jgi:hypothetical protein
MGKLLLTSAVVVMMTTAGYADTLYCWQAPDYGTKHPPTCALTYSACQQLVSRNGGACRSM